MGIIVLLGVAMLAAAAAAIVIVRWAVGRNREPPGFPIEPGSGKQGVDREDRPR